MKLTKKPWPQRQCQRPWRLDKSWTCRGLQQRQVGPRKFPGWTVEHHRRGWWWCREWGKRRHHFDSTGRENAKHCPVQLPKKEFVFFYYFFFSHISNTWHDEVGPWWPEKWNKKFNKSSHHLSRSGADWVENFFAAVAFSPLAALELFIGSPFIIGSISSSASSPLAA